MRKRMIDPEFWSDEEIGKWSFETRLFYIGLWNFADDAGRFKANPQLLRSQIFPYEKKFDFEHLKKELNGKVQWYKVEGLSYGYLRNFNKHQRIDRPTPSKLPAPVEHGAVEVETPPVVEKPKEMEKVKELATKTIAEFVTMTEEQFRSLVADYGILKVKEYAVKVSHYCGASGKRYKRYDCAIRQFMAKDNVKKVVVVKVEKPLPPEERADPALVHKLCSNTIAKIGGAK